MQLPLHNPDMWVVFKQGAGHNMGKIIGASFMDNRGWVYDIIKPGLGAQFIVVEGDILYKQDSSTGVWAQIKAE